MARDDIGLLLVGAGALLILAKWGIGNINVPNPFPAAGQAAKKTAEELTGGLSKSSGETWDEWAFQFDPPFTDKRLPLFPGLVRDEGEVYTTETTGAVAMDIAEPRQSYGDYLTEVDLPGLPPYDLKDAPGDIYRGTIISGPDIASGQGYGDYLTEIDLPGLPAYDLKDAPGDIYRGIRSLF